MFSANSSQVSDDKLFVEDVFSTYLYTGNGSTQTITNGIDLAGKGGLVWIKSRSNAVTHNLQDTVRGANIIISSNSTAAQYDGGPAGVNFSFNSSGFSQNNAFTDFNASGVTYASWTFREAPKFFDVVTYTGNGVSGRQIAHSLGVNPGCILIKKTGTTSDWFVYHQSLGYNSVIKLNTTGAAYSDFGPWDSGPFTSTTFRVGTNGPNDNGATYVAYLYAHDATADGLIQCGSFTTDGSNVVANVTLGWEPQWMMIKRADGTGNWMLYDNMRGMPVGPSGYSRELYPNTSGAEANGFIVAPNATGFSSPYYSAANATYVYIAIRRPMKTPTLGTSVFAPFAASASVDTAITTNFPVDLMISGQRNSNNSTDNWAFIDRLRGATASDNTNSAPQKRLRSTSTSAENNPTYPYAYNWWNTGLVQGYGLAGASQIYYTLRRAPGFFDEVCYTTSNAGPNFGANQRVNHNLSVVPELILHKPRNVALDWLVYSGSQGVSKFASLNQTTAFTTSTNIWGTAPTATDFGINVGATYGTGYTMVAYLFASCPGVSKVGSYTGNGSSQTINCGFAAGARFVMIKRTDSTGDWYVWDTARGIVAGNDPHLSLNTIDAEVTTDDTIDTNSSGFVVNQVAATNVNVSSATYIYLAIA
jgi:hypothetical protein